MNPFWLFLLAIFSPLLLSVTLLLPLYGGVVGAAYFIYDQGTADPLAGQWLNVFYMIDVYVQLFNYWLGHASNVSFVHYTLPIAGLMGIMVLLALWLTHKAAKIIMHLFHLASGNAA